MAVNKNFRITADGKVYRQGRKRYPSGDIYEGEFVDGMREGRGVLNYSNGNRYVGEWKENQFAGFGVFVWAPFPEAHMIVRGRRYEGNFESGTKQGRGMLILGQGDVYEGEFKGDEYGGEGTLTMANGDILSGNWKRGQLSGRAHIMYRNGDVYEGDFKAGKFHGRGRFVFADGRGWYEGGYELGRQQGQGLRVFANNNRYDGTFHDGDFGGEGIMEYINGDVYMGSWQRGQRHGRGVLQLKSGARYEGNFHLNEFFGYGRYTWPDGTYYEGEYVRLKGGYASGAKFPDPNGKRNGRGIRVYINGDKYEGEWVEDLAHGIGLVRKHTGGVFEGRFKRGMRTGSGRETWGNNINNHFECPMGFKHEGRGFCCYEGDYLDGHFHGHGVFTCVEGRTYEGSWKRGLRHGWGVQVMINRKERGQPRRHFIGGCDALYRMETYRGEWEGGQRTGQGMVEYPNGLKLCGELINGQFEGTVKFVWPRDQGTRLALYRHGSRISWLPAQVTPGVFLGGPQGVATDNESLLAEILGRPKPKTAAQKANAGRAATADPSAAAEAHLVKPQSPTKTLKFDM